MFSVPFAGGSVYCEKKECMTYVRDQTPGQDLNADSKTHVTAAPTSVGPLDGAWFRRERERIAVGRRAIAKHLQVAESRVVALETKGQQVPGPWLSVLAGLGFRLLPQAETPPSQAVDSVAAAKEPEVLAAPHQDSVSAPDPSPPAPEQDKTPPSASSKSAEPAAAAAVSKEPESAPAAPQDSAQVDSRAKPAMDGGWLQAERERLGLSRNTMRRHLDIHWATCARIEERKLPVPKRYWRKLKELGFQVADSADAAPKPKKSAAAAVAVAAPVSLRGSWLRRERKRLGLSHRELWQALKVHWRTVTTVEGSNRAIPATWLPALRRLGMAISGAPADARPAAVKTPKAVTPPAAASPPSAKPAEHDSPRELLAMIVNYRLTLGRRSCQSAIETLGLIVQDLRTSNLSQAFTHDELAQALSHLLQAKS